MTGNNKVWRASLAGLASVAMLATMGVVAGTANAADAAARFKATVSFEGTAHAAVTGYKGESLADLVGGYGVEPTGLNAADNTKTEDGVKYYFGGWTVDGKTPVDWNAPITDDIKVKPLLLTNGYTDLSGKTDVVLLDFSEVDGTSSINKYEQLPAGTTKFYVKKDAAVPAALLPVDRVDKHLLTSYTYTTNKDANVEKTVAAADLANVTTSNTDLKAETVTFKAPKDSAIKDAYTVIVDGTAKAPYGYVKGAKSDRGESGAYSPDATKYAPENILGVDVEPGKDFTVPEWFTIPQYGEPNQTVKSWTYAGGNVTVGSKVTVNADLTLEPTKGDAAVAKGYKATFLADKGGAVWQTTDAAKNDATGSYFVTAPEGTPTKDGFQFAGWRASDKNAQDLFGVNTLIRAESDGLYKEFVNTPINANVEFFPVFTNRATSVKVTFRDQDYNGSQKDATVEVTVPGTLEESQTPKWTRAGYTLDHWVKDANGNGKFDAAEETAAAYNFTEWLTDNDADFTLFPVWQRATAEKAKDALNYIAPADKDNLQDLYKQTVDNAGYKAHAANDGADFTKESFDAYKAAYKAALEKYGTDVYNNPNTQVTAEASAEIINDINAALQKLQFKHEGGAEQANALGKFQGVHRLYNPSLNRHLYSNDAFEIQALTSTESTKGGWEDNGPLFYGALQTLGTTAGDWDGKLDASNKYGDGANDTVKAAVKAGVKPIVTAYVRFFNPSTGDHVYTAEGGSEDKDLSANATWNREGVAYYVPAFTGTQDVTRLYNKGTDRHLFSSDASEQAGLVKDGWTVEGFAFKGV